ncbi:hypothetical protein MATL_G00147600 [Megalops atlanticus]|uniref:Uncharacterized protein n=1 Tax=Megalops atlanticus TaxID=7932 RepID=A0A9D3T208_MEGAT|nr:hypothetical protein MATL_G00147600 [Megalops atlanticus]
MKQRDVGSAECAVPQPPALLRRCRIQGEESPLRRPSPPPPASASVRSGPGCLCPALLRTHARVCVSQLIPDRSSC